MMSPKTPSLLPSGVRHQSTTGIADNWHTWDRLADQYEHDENWRLERRFNSETGVPIEWLSGMVDGCEVTIHQPLTAPRAVSGGVVIRLEDFNRTPYDPSMEGKDF